MNIFELQEKFNTHIKCIRHLEEVRWGDKPICPHCGAENISIRVNGASLIRNIHKEYTKPILLIVIAATGILPY